MNNFDNKYNLFFQKDLLSDYFDFLIKSCYRNLPLYEGRDFKTKQIIYRPEQAYEQYRKYLQKFTLEICGAYYLFNNNYNFLILLTSLEGMQTIVANEHHKLKPMVMQCINILKKLKEDVENGI